MESSKTPAAIRSALAEQAFAEPMRDMPSIRTAAALEVCLMELMRLLISKDGLDPQEALDAFVRASDAIQSRLGSEIAVQTVERLCSAIAELPGANRLSA